jgi:hypothetical protein
MEPFGEERADLRAGIIASTVANAATGGRGNFRASDFMPDFEPRRQSVAEMQSLMMHVSRVGERSADKRGSPKAKRTK